MAYAELSLLNGNIYTMDPSKPRAEALAILHGRILKVGLNEEVRRFIGGKTRVIDLRGKTVLPGLIDTHAHMMGFGLSLGWVNLRDASSIREVIKRLREVARKTPRGRWIVGFGWDQERFEERRFPTRWDLDEASEEHPIVIFRVCLHLCVANSAALKLVGILGTDAVEGVEVDPDVGEPNGILRESAVELVRGALPQPTLKEAVDAAERACREAAKAGLTGVHWIMGGAVEFRAVQRLRAEGRLPIRVYAILPVDMLDPLTKLGVEGRLGDEWVKIGGVKVFVDGSLGARTAALKEPYSDKPETSGVLLYTREELRSLAVKAHEAGLQLVIHAIGDRAVELALDAIEHALKAKPRPNHRHRIEHASLLSGRLVNWMRELGVVASIQPHFVVSDFWVEERVGPERARWVYPFRTLLRSGVVVSAGSDCPVEPINPFLGVWAAVHRMDNAEEALSVEEALRLYTVNAAYASFEEELKGSLTEGKLADLVILDRDPYKVPPSELRDVRVVATIVGGRLVYAEPSFLKDAYPSTSYKSQ